MFSLRQEHSAQATRTGTLPKLTTSPFASILAKFTLPSIYFLNIPYRRTSWTSHFLRYNQSEHFVDQEFLEISASGTSLSQCHDTEPTDQEASKGTLICLIFLSFMFFFSIYQPKDCLDIFLYFLKCADKFLLQMQIRKTYYCLLYTSRCV